MYFKSLLADIRLVCPGMPEPWQYRFLTRSLQVFLSDTEVWQEWTQYAWDFTAASGGLYEIPNAKYNPTGPVDPYPFVRASRVLRVKWMPTGENIAKVTADELDRCEQDWMTQRSKEPRAWAPAPSAFGEHGGYRVRLYPHPADVVDDTAAALRFLVAHTVTETETPDDVLALETAVGGNVADWLFRRYRETVVAGTLARALAVPGVDWSNPQLAMQYGAAFTFGVDRARSETQAGQTTSHVVVAYGGY
jgi:hypothetical protein